MRRLKATFRVTGGEEEATEFCGLQIVRDWEARTITLSQEAFARKMMAKYDVSGRAEATPLKVSKSKLEPYTGEPCEETSFDYSMALGDLAWYARTNPGCPLWCTRWLSSCGVLARTTSKPFTTCCAMSKAILARA